MPQANTNPIMMGTVTAKDVYHLATGTDQDPVTTLCGKPAWMLAWATVPEIEEAMQNPDLYCKGCETAAEMMAEIYHERSN